MFKFHFFSQFMLSVLGLFLTQSSHLFAQKEDFSVAKIDPNLKSGADAVVRLQETIFDIKDKGTATTKYRYVCTIFNKDGDSESQCVVSFDQLTKIKNLDGKLYDANGKVVSKLKKSDIYETGATDGLQFVSDSHVKVARFSYGNYPYTIEFEYETTSKNLMFYPMFVPQESPKFGVEKSSLLVISPKELKLRYKENNFSNACKKSQKDGKDTYLWELNNVPTAKLETYGLPWNAKAPWVQTAPSEFEVQGYEGKFQTWEDYGKFNNDLRKERDIVPQATQEEIKKLVANEPTKFLKAKKVYEYMQSRTRYMFIGLGIGGWQPMPAQEVDKKGYGDCKALTNYTKSLLKVVGIDSHYSLVNAGDDSRDVVVDEKFPSPRFNHAFLCIPMEKDTVWVECTSQNAPFGYIGDFTDDRNVLITTENGGKVVHTKKYTALDNTQNTNAIIKVNEAGEGEIDATTTYRGRACETNHLMHIAEKAPETQRKWVNENTPLPDFELSEFKIDLKKTLIPEVAQKRKLKARNIFPRTGKRLFITPNLLNKFDEKLEVDENRKEDIFLKGIDFSDNDTITYYLPEKYHIEGTTNDVKITSPFGEYKSQIKAEQGKITYTRQFMMKKGHYSKEKAKELNEFIKNVKKADNTKIVCVKGT